MNESFSQKLINETILVFREEDGVELSVDQAIQCLQRLSGLFIAFTPNGLTGSVQPAPFMVQAERYVTQNPAYEIKRGSSLLLSSSKENCISQPRGRTAGISGLSAERPEYSI